MDPADRDRVFVADLAAERAGLGEANVMRFGWRAAADDAGLCGDELAVLLVAQADGLRRNATAPDVACPLPERASAAHLRSGIERLLDCEKCGRSVGRRQRSASRAADCPPSIVSSLSRKLASTVSASAGIRVFFAGEVLVDPVGGLVRGFEIAELGDQSVAQRLRLVRGQHDPRRPDHLALPTGASAAAKDGSSVAGFVDV